MQILQCLTVQSAPGSGGDSGSISRGIVKDRFKTFNAQFEEIHQRQSQWTVPDSELRESLRLAVAEVLLPAYRSFIKRFGQVPSFFSISFTKTFLCFSIPLFMQIVYANVNVHVHRPMIENGKNPTKYIRYRPEDLERMLNEFFEGKTWNDPKR